MDGVIIDSDYAWKQAEKEVFTSLGVTITDRDSEITHSLTTQQVANFWFEKYPWKGATTYAVEQRVISRVIELIETSDCSIGGVQRFMENLKENHYKVGLATNSPYRIIPAALKKARKLHVAPQHCIAIEDSPTGMLAARHAGMTVVAFTPGMANVKDALADYTINSFETFDIHTLPGMHAR